MILLKITLLLFVASLLIAVEGEETVLNVFNW